ncbi:MULTISPECIES: glycosyltransferase [Rhodobacterales]|uniref:glycosyltransferase family 2 protein n=1 Tax=Rhodobacterales TaxID=204455 RepID=UPI003297BA06
MTSNHPTPPQYAIIIPHYNDVVRLKRCLSALVDQLDGRAELVVVDNSSTDDLAPIHQAFPDVRFITETQKGAGIARNRGVADTTAPYLFFLDADCVPAGDWFAVACETVADDAVIGGDVAVFHETAPPLTGAQAFEAVFAFNQKNYVLNKGFSVTANLLTTRAVFERTGVFRVGVSEDLDWCLRATAAGSALRYAPDLRVSHPSRNDWPELKRKWRRLVEESFGLQASGLRGRLVWARRAVMMFASPFAHLPTVLRHGSLMPGEKYRAAVTLFRLRWLRGAWMFQQAVFGRI